MTIQPHITLSIVSHGDAEKIRHLLTSLQDHERNTLRFQLILTDNLKNDLPDFDSSPWASLHILRNEYPIGFAENHNKAFELAEAKHFAILNPDLIFKQPIFDGLIARIDNRQADLIAPRIIDENGTTQDSFRSLPTPLGIIQRRLPMYRFQSIDPDVDGLIYPDWIAAMFWLMPSDVYRAMEGLDKKYKLYFEDVDFCTRAKLRGLKLAVDSRLYVQHNAQRSSRSNIYYFSLHVRSALRFFLSHVYKQARRKYSISHFD